MPLASKSAMALPTMATLVMVPPMMALLSTNTPWPAPVLPPVPSIRFPEISALSACTTTPEALSMPVWIEFPVTVALLAVGTISTAETVCCALACTSKPARVAPLPAIKMALVAPAPTSAKSSTGAPLPCNVTSSAQIVSVPVGALALTTVPA